MGAFGGRREIMDRLAPDGPVYQAGTLSGNPLAVAAGTAALKALKKRGKVRKQRIEKFRFKPDAKNVQELVHILNNELASRKIEGYFVVFKGKEKNKKMTKRMSHSLGLVLEDIFKKSKSKELEKAIFVII